MLRWKKIVNLGVFSSCNYFSETSPRDLILVHTLKKYRVLYEIQNALFKVRDVIFLFQPAVGRMVSRDRLVVRTLRCGRSNPGSNPVPGMTFLKLPFFLFCQGVGKFSS